MDADKAAQQDDDDANQWERYPWAATAQQLRTHQFRYESSSDESDGDTVDLSLIHISEPTRPY